MKKFKELENEDQYEIEFLLSFNLIKRMPDKIMNKPIKECTEFDRKKYDVHSRAWMVLQVACLQL